MQYLIPLLIFFCGFALGAVVVWLLSRAKIAGALEHGRSEAAAETAALAEKITARDETIEELRVRLSTADAEQDKLRKDIAALNVAAAELRERLAAEQKQAQEKLALLDDAKRQLADAFKALAAEALKSSNTSFLELAKTQLEKFQESARGDLDKRQTAIDELVKPVRESLAKVDAKLLELENKRIEAYSGLVEQVRSLSETQKELRGETANLVRALRRPQARGRWGEIQLKRVVEMAGMLDHCDFFEQQTIEADAGRLRPDMVVHLPGRHTIAVDAKAPLEAYLEAIEAPDDQLRAEKMKDHARQVRNHIAALGKRSYAEQLDRSPDFVVLFLPGEVFYLAALEHDPSLLEAGVGEGVLIASPTSLIALLRAAAYGWREEQLAENAKKISELGQELYKRISDWGEHLQKLGRSLGSAVAAYNAVIGSLESRVLPGARRFKELGAGGGDEIEELRQIEATSRLPQATELLAGDGG
jgi:DNA recombination protein RmuC